MEVVTKPETVDYYLMLGVKASATKAELAKGYRRQSLRVHPDKHPGEEAKYQAKFVALKAAYDFLNNTDRTKYDFAYLKLRAHWRKYRAFVRKNEDALRVAEDNTRKQETDARRLSAHKAAKAANRRRTEDRRREQEDRKRAQEDATCPSFLVREQIKARRDAEDRRRLNEEGRRKQEDVLLRNRVAKTAREEERWAEEDARRAEEDDRRKEEDELLALQRGG